jgi:hypothetical protein
MRAILPVNVLIKKVAPWGDFFYLFFPGEINNHLPKISFFHDPREYK